MSANRNIVWKYVQKGLETYSTDNFSSIVSERWSINMIVGLGDQEVCHMVVTNNTVKGNNNVSG